MVFGTAALVILGLIFLIRIRGWIRETRARMAHAKKAQQEAARVARHNERAVKVRRFHVVARSSEVR